MCHCTDPRSFDCLLSNDHAVLLIKLECTLRSVQVLCYLPSCAVLEVLHVFCCSPNAVYLTHHGLLTRSAHPIIDNCRSTVLGVFNCLQAGPPEQQLNAIGSYVSFKAMCSCM